MPGEITSIDGPFVIGHACHPVHKHYPVVIHGILQGMIASTVLADIALENGRHGFLLHLPRSYQVHELSVLIGETDEYLPIPHKKLPSGRALTVEDLIGLSVAERSWVDGSCDIDAAKAGLNLETIIDLLCRDYLGRAADFSLIGEVLPLVLEERGFSSLRRRLINSQEYKSRRITAERAPGTIFSSKMVKLASSRDFVESSPASGPTINFSAELMLEPDNEVFVKACYAHIHGRAPDRATISSFVHDLEVGQPRQEVVRNMAMQLNKG